MLGEPEVAGAMPVRVRLQRFGRRGRPFYRVVVADSRAPRDGKFIEIVGNYDPIANRSGVKEVTFNVERVKYWLSVGAQASDRVEWLLGQFGILPPQVPRTSQTMQHIPKKQRAEALKGGQSRSLHTYREVGAIFGSRPWAGLGSSGVGPCCALGGHGLGVGTGSLLSGLGSGVFSGVASSSTSLLTSGSEFEEAGARDKSVGLSVEGAEEVVCNSLQLKPPVVVGGSLHAWSDRGGVPSTVPPTIVPARKSVWGG
ncbi:unnamed protein product [Choristocarpus tenellus]